MAKMTKNLSQRIAERIKNKRPTKKAKNRADFLVQKNDIEQAIADGWAVRIIWETLLDEKKISLSYPAFNNYVNKLINKKKLKIKEEPIKQTTTSSSSSSSVSGFTYDPKPDQDNLI